MENITLTETGIIVIVSMFITFVGTVLNIVFNIWSKKHDAKMQSVLKQFELYYEEKSKIFEEFTINASLLHTHIKSVERYDLFYSSALKTSLLCSHASQKLIKKLLSYTNEALLTGMNVDKSWEVCFLNQVSDITFLLGKELKETSDILITKPKRYTKLQE